MQKYRKVGLLGILWLCCILGGCKKDEKEPVTITVIHSWGGTGDDHVAMRNIYEEFQEENPDIVLQLISMPTRDEMQRKVEDMIMVGDTPDIVTFSGMGKNRTYDFMVENDMALDVMPYLEADSELKSSISDANLKYWTTEDNQLFTVSDVLTLSGGYWYNKDILEQAGVDKVPETWGEFLMMCETLQNWSEEQHQDIRAHQVSGEGYLYFMNHLLADSGIDQSVSVRNSGSELQSEKFEEAIERLREIYSFSASESADYTYLDETSLFNEGKLAIYVNGVWGAPMIFSDINVGYALLPTDSGVPMSCESACLGYVLGNSGNKEKEQAAVKFLKYMLSEPVQKRILRETEQIPANSKVSLEDFAAEKTRLYQAAMLVLDAERKTEAPDNLWSKAQKAQFTGNIVKVLSGELSEQNFRELLEINKE